MLKHAGGVLSTCYYTECGAGLQGKNGARDLQRGRKGRFTRADFCVIMPEEALTASIFHEK